MTVAVLTGMSHVHGSPARRHHTARHWASPEGAASAGRAELGDARIPVRSIRTRSASYGEREPSRPRIVYGETGGKAASPEVIVGYVDPDRGPKAFHRLTKVVQGDRVKVVRQDHSVAWFKVDSVRRALRRDLERERSETGRPELHLISPRGKRARDVVVSAHLDRPEE